MTAYEVDKASWAFKLAPQLTGRVQQAYAALDPSDAECYDKVKAAILQRYNINGETYHQRLCTLKFKAGKTPTEIATRLTDLAGRWLKDCHTVEEVKDAVVKEQLLITLPEDVCMWVKERKLKTTGEATQLAEDYFQARPQGTQKSDRVPIVTNDPCPRCGEHCHWARHCPTNPKPSATQPPQTQPLPMSTRDRNTRAHNNRPTNHLSCSTEVKCFNCNEKGHLSYHCPLKALFGCPATKPFTNQQQERVHHHGIINGVYSKQIVVDTGVGKTLVRGDVITPDDIIDGEVTIQCAHGDVVSQSLAAVKITLGGKEIIIHTAVPKSLPVATLLGWDVPELMGLIKPTPEVHSDATKVLAVVTRNQEKAKDLPSPVIDSPT